jgi:uncharacterized RDD family membrane protein YckC
MAYAPVGRRALAAVVDVVLLFALGWVIAVLTGNTTDGGFSLEGAPAVLLFLLWFGYFVVTELTLGASLGKRVAGVRVVREDGSPIDLQAALVRNVVRFVDVFFCLVGAVVALSSPSRQRIGDRLAHTVVVAAG